MVPPPCGLLLRLVSVKLWVDGLVSINLYGRGGQRSARAGQAGTRCQTELIRQCHSPVMNVRLDLLGGVRHTFRIIISLISRHIENIDYKIFFKNKVSHARVLKSNKQPKEGSSS